MPYYDLPPEIHLLLEALKIREENGFDFPSSLQSLNLTISKSALINRMLSGKKPLTIPPPKSFSYPWYSIIEDGYGYPFEVWKSDLFKEEAIIIDQSIWKLEKQLADNDYVVSYYYGINNSLVSETKWHVFAIGSRLPQSKKDNPSNLLWKIELISDYDI